MVRQHFFEPALFAIRAAIRPQGRRGIQIGENWAGYYFAQRKPHRDSLVRRRDASGAPYLPAAQKDKLYESYSHHFQPHQRLGASWNRRKSRAVH